MRVLVSTIDYPPPPGGIQTVAKNLSDGINKIGHSSKVLYENGEKSRYKFRHYIPHTKFLYSRSSFMDRHFVYDKYLHEKTEKEIKEYNPDIIHAMHIRNWGSLIAARESMIPSVLSVHSMELQNKALARCAINIADGVHCPSKFTEGLVNEIDPNAKTYVVPPSINIGLYGRERNENEKNYVMCMARMVERKNIDVVIKAWDIINSSRNNNYELLIVGDGPQRDYLTSLAEEIDRVRFTGWVSEKEKRELLAGAKAFVLVPTRSGYDTEGFGIVFLEARASNTPIVGSKCGGVPEAINGDGILVDDENSPIQVANQLKKIMIRINENKTPKLEKEELYKYEIDNISMEHIDEYKNIVKSNNYKKGY